MTWKNSRVKWRFSCTPCMLLLDSSRMPGHSLPATEHRRRLQSLPQQKLLLLQR